MSTMSVVGRIYNLASEISDYRFDRPVFVLAESLRFCEDDEFADGASFIKALRDVGTAVLGIIIPLELKTILHYAQELLGLDLLEWIRWAGSPLEQLPVLALSWFTFEKLQRLRTSLLLSHSATQFLRLPTPPDTLERFVEDVRFGRFAQDGGSWEAVRGGAAIDSALTHHDLANDYYGAYRLWVGYAAALKQTQMTLGASVALTCETKRVANVQFTWMGKLEEKLNQPHVRRFQAGAERDEFPAYPEPNEQERSDTYRMLLSLLTVGLCAGTRVLFVDDQFKKGWAEVLLKILFRVEAFTYETEHEAVYAEAQQNGKPQKSGQPMWARFVCVDSAERARFWLDYWGLMALQVQGAAQARASWAEEWAGALNIAVEKSSELQDVLGHSSAGSVDAPSARPKDVTTIALLDLRLESQHQPRIFNVADLNSIRLRSDLKMQQSGLPIIMFTASRHAITATQIMRNSSDADGWYVKEAPDVPPNDENTARGVLYLLDRVHLFSQLHLWYRESLEWDSERKLEYAHFYNSPYRAHVLQHIEAHATQIFEHVRAGTTGWDNGGYPTYFAFIQEQAPVQRFEIESTLVARRVALATLLLTASAEAGELRWNAGDFNRVLPGSPQARTVKAVYDKLNFNRVLWLRTRDIHTQLLPEEVEWLSRIQWLSGTRAPIERFLSRATAETKKERRT